MNNKGIRPVLVRKVSTTETLMRIETGQSVVIPTKDIKTANIRNTAWRLEKRGVASFEVTELGLVNETKVTRLR